MSDRSKKIIMLCHCILNANSKVAGIAKYSGGVTEVINYLLNQGIGIIQLPCPEMTIYGLKRWGHVKEQFDTPYYRNHCKTIFQPYLQQIQDYINNGYEVIGVVGLNGSPSCGVDKTCSGNCSGEVSHLLNNNQTLAIEYVNGKGVFIEEIQNDLQGLDIKFIGIEELDTNGALQAIKTIF